MISLTCHGTDPYNNRERLGDTNGIKPDHTHLYAIAAEQLGYFMAAPARSRELRLTCGTDRLRYSWTRRGGLGSSHKDPVAGKAVAHVGVEFSVATGDN